MGMNWERWDGEPDDESVDDPEGPQDIDLEGEDSDDFGCVPCPSCGEEVSELAEQCPHCGDWITPHEGRTRRSPWWIALAIVLLAAFLMWVL